MQESPLWFDIQYKRVKVQKIVGFAKRDIGECKACL